MIIRDGTNNYPALHKRFRDKMGYDLNLLEPRTYSEKMQWRKVRDRRPILATFADKFAVQEYVENKVGTQKADEILNRPIVVTEDPDAVDFSTLPEQYVVKANHASGWNVLVTRDSPANELLLRKHMERWLRRSYGKSKLEWAYQRVPRKIMIEPFVDAGELPLPDDIQFFMFGGGLFSRLVEA